MNNVYKNLTSVLGHNLNFELFKTKRWAFILFSYQCYKQIGFMTLILHYEIISMQLIKNNILWIIGGILGAVAGYFYWQHVGCMSGSCSITSSPINSTLYGAITGSLFLNLFKTNILNTK